MRVGSDRTKKATAQLLKQEYTEGTNAYRLYDPRGDKVLV